MDNVTLLSRTRSLRLEGDRFMSVELVPDIGGIFPPFGVGALPYRAEAQNGLSRPTILSTLLDAGIAVDHSCGEGVCGSCETRVLAGEPGHRDSVLSKTQRAGNNVMMICVSDSKSDKLVLDL
jgi:ferredoxin